MHITMERYQFDFDSAQIFYDLQMYFLLQCDVALDYCQENDVGVECRGMYGYIDPEDKKFYVYNNGVRICVFSLSGEHSASSALVEVTEGDKAREKGVQSLALSVLLPCFSYAYQIRSNKLQCTVSEEEWFSKYIPTTMPHIGQVKHYTGNQPFYVHKREGKGVSIFVNGVSGKEFSFPSVIFPIPGSNIFHVFYSENTKILADGGELARLASTVSLTYTKPYHGTQNLLDILILSGYTKHHNVELYGGWVITYPFGDIKHRIWLVVDGESVIDIGNWKDNPILKNTMEGDIQKDNRSEDEKKWSFKDVNYGDTQDCLYAGCKTTQKEMIQMVLELSSIYRDHPGINNVWF